MFVICPGSRNYTDPNDLEGRLRIFCGKYWGTGEEGRRAICKQIEINIPPCFELQQSGQSDDLAIGDPQSVDEYIDDDETKSSPSDDTPTLFDIISLGPELDRFYGMEVDCLLIRKEYLSLKEHLEGLYAKGERGVVVLGQPGIGKSLRISQF